MNGKKNTFREYWGGLRLHMRHKGQHTCDWTPAEERTLGGSHFYRMREFPQIDEVCQTTISRNVTNLKQNKYKENPTFIPME